MLYILKVFIWVLLFQVEVSDICDAFMEPSSFFFYHLVIPVHIQIHIHCLNIHCLNSTNSITFELSLAEDDDDDDETGPSFHWRTFLETDCNNHQLLYKPNSNTNFLGLRCKV